MNGKLINFSVWNGSYDGECLSGLGDRPGDLLEVPSAIWGPVVFVNIIEKRSHLITISHLLRRYLKVETLTHLIISLPDGPERTHTQRAQFYRKEATTSSAYLEARIETADEFRGAGIEDGRITEAIKHDAILD